MNKKEALEILDLNENSTDDQIKVKFENFSRLYKKNNSVELAKITEAYSLLTKHLEYKNAEKSELKKAQENFWYHNRVYIKIISVVLLLVVIGAIVIALYNNLLEQPNVTILFIGDELLSSEEILSVENSCISNLEFEKATIFSYKLVDEKNDNTNEITYDELTDISLQFKAAFVITNDSIARLLNTNDMVVSLFDEELKKIGFIKDGAEKINIFKKEEYKVSLVDKKDMLVNDYNYNNSEYPYYISIDGNKVFNIDSEFKYNRIAILNNNYWNNDTFKMIKKVLINSF